MGIADIKALSQAMYIFTNTYYPGGGPGGGANAPEISGEGRIVFGWRADCPS